MPKALWDTTSFAPPGKHFAAEDNSKMGLQDILDVLIGLVVPDLNRPRYRSLLRGGECGEVRGLRDASQHDVGLEDLRTQVEAQYCLQLVHGNRNKLAPPRCNECRIPWLLMKYRALAETVASSEMGDSLATLECTVRKGGAIPYFAHLALLHKVYASGQITLSDYSCGVFKDLRDQVRAEAVFELGRERAEEHQRVQERSVFCVVLLRVGLEDVLKVRTIDAPHAARLLLGRHRGGAGAVVEERRPSEGSPGRQRVDHPIVHADLEGAPLRHEEVAAYTALLHHSLALPELEELHEVHERPDLALLQQSAEPVLPQRRGDELPRALAHAPRHALERQYQRLPAPARQLPVLRRHLGGLDHGRRPLSPAAFRRGARPGLARRDAAPPVLVVLVLVQVQGQVRHAAAAAGLLAAGLFPRFLRSVDLFPCFLRSALFLLSPLLVSLAILVLLSLQHF
mmetsp:Transcript_88912/g.259869  ORF Transcript_88912/g.259869 Transcript_88912/m.259869 type:complete len:455 (-) Transcript_88912:545-1909(-)